MTILPDVLKPGLRIVFCGTAVGPKSAEVSAYYAGPGNKFWWILAESGLTPHILDPSEYQDLLNYGIGLTDLVKTHSGADRNIKRATEEDIVGFRRKVEKYEPKAVGFNGKKAAMWFYNLKSTKEIDYGRQLEDIAQTAVFVLPSTSSANERWWDDLHWHELAKYLKAKFEV